MKEKVLIILAAIFTIGCNWGSETCQNCSCSEGCCESGACDTEACACVCKE